MSRRFDSFADVVRNRSGCCVGKGVGECGCFQAPPALSPWRGPRLCTVWNEEVLRMFAPWIYVRPGAYVYWPARRPGWLDEVKKGTKVEFCFPRQWNSNSYDLDPAVVLPVDGIQVAR